jgi:hypothetical protein
MIEQEMPRSSENRDKVRAGNSNITSASLTIKPSNGNNAVINERANFRAEATILSKKLIDVVRDGQINTPGQHGQWYWRFWYLPPDLKEYVWFELSKTIDHDVFRQLQSGWKEYSCQQQAFLNARKARRRLSCKR